MRSMAMRQVKLFVLMLLGYLFQVCVMPYFQVGDRVTPSMLVACIAIATVGYGRLRALWIGAFYGIVMETFYGAVPMLYLLLYPVSALLCSVPCADKSASRLQYERSIGKAGRNRSPLLRTLLCALLNSVIIEIVCIIYNTLDGSPVTANSVYRAIVCVVSTVVLTAIIMAPVRKLLGFRKPAPENPADVRFGKPLKLED